jgi:erythritol transport system ATP-binding protein
VSTQTPHREIPENVILRAEKISKLYPGTVALNKVDFNVYRGKVNVLVGENGAGKSTLMKVLSGVEQPTSGHLFLEGKEVSFKSVRDAGHSGIGIIFQELNLFPNLNIAENIFIAREHVDNHVSINHKTQLEQARELLERLEHPVDPKTLVGDLRIGQQQIVEIAKALSQDVNILIMDEPTSALSSEEVEVLFRIIHELKSQGVAIIYISHRLEELITIGDYITVLRDGNLQQEKPMGDIDVPWIIEQMVGEASIESVQTAKHSAGDELLSVENLSLPRQGGGFTVDHLSFSLRAGEIVGIYGLMGAGRSELFECLMGLHPESSGTIRISQQEVPSRSTIDKRIRMGLALVPEDRKRDGLVQMMSVEDNMTLACLWKFVKGFVHIVKAKQNRDVNRMIEDMSVKVASPEMEVNTLSGGNQQKVVIGKGLLTTPKILLMDEPTRGIDVGAKAEVFQIMGELAAQGIGVLFVTSELKEILAISDRVIVMSKGRITGEFDRTGATEEALVSASAIGHGIATA